MKISKSIQLLRTAKHCISTVFQLKEGFLIDVVVQSWKTTLKNFIQNKFFRIGDLVKNHIGKGFLFDPFLVPFKTTILVKSYISVIVLLIGGLLQDVLRKELPITSFTESFKTSTFSLTDEFYSTIDSLLTKLHFRTESASNHREQ